MANGNGYVYTSGKSVVAGGNVPTVSDGLLDASGQAVKAKNLSLKTTSFIGHGAHTYSYNTAIGFVILQTGQQSIAISNTLMVSPNADNSPKAIIVTAVNDAGGPTSPDAVANIFAVTVNEEGSCTILANGVATADVILQVVVLGAL
jgi:hypothetical protein